MNQEIKESENFANFQETRLGKNAFYEETKKANQQLTRTNTNHPELNLTGLYQNLPKLTFPNLPKLIKNLRELTYP